MRPPAAPPTPVLEQSMSVEDKIDALFMYLLAFSDWAKRQHSYDRAAYRWARGEHYHGTTITDATESHSITDPSDAPVDADELRDDLVANTLPDIVAALNALGVTMNEILAALRG